MATSNYDTIQLQVATESLYEMSFRELTDTLTITDSKSGDTIVVPYNSLINRYRYYLQDHIEEMEFNEIQYETFRQNPQALSEALYGTIHFWHILLELNNCISRTKFNVKKVKYYSPNKIYQLINEIQLKAAQEKEINIS